MATYPRGRVTKITLTIEYPDGSTKELVVDDPDNLTSIAFASEAVSEEHRGQYDVSTDDWTLNPTIMTVYNRDGHGYHVPACSLRSGPCS